MGRSERYIPENTDGVLVEVTCRVIGARALLVPSPNPRKFNEVVVGVLGRALEVSPLELCAGVFTANHLHLLAIVEQQQNLSRFMAHLGCNLSKEVGRLRDWRGAMWERRYDAIVVSSEPEAQWCRLKYLMSHGVKEQLVETSLDWPGVHAAKALLHGEPLEGFWFNRSKECAARHRGEDHGPYDYATRYRIELTPLPAFRHLTAEEYQDEIAKLLVEIEEEGRVARDGRPVAGVEKILRQNPYEPPTRKTKRSIKPLFHVKDRDVRDDLRAEYREFVTQYREASEAYCSGHREALGWFPAGCYPPAYPFLGKPAPTRPPRPPTRQLTTLESGKMERGPIPVIEIAARPWAAEPPVAVSRGQPP